MASGNKLFQKFYPQYKYFLSFHHLPGCSYTDHTWSCNTLYHMNLTRCLLTLSSHQIWNIRSMNLFFLEKNVETGHQRSMHETPPWRIYSTIPHLIPLACHSSGSNSWWILAWTWFSYLDSLFGSFSKMNIFLEASFLALDATLPTYLSKPNLLSLYLRRGR